MLLSEETKKHRFFNALCRLRAGLVEFDHFTRAPQSRIPSKIYLHLRFGQFKDVFLVSVWWLRILGPIGGPDLGVRRSVLWRKLTSNLKRFRFKPKLKGTANTRINPKCGMALEDYEGYQRLVDLITGATSQDAADPAWLRLIKQACKSSESNVRNAFDLLFAKLEKPNSEVSTPAAGA